MGLVAPLLMAAACGGSAAHIDFVDFVMLGGITYVAAGATAPAGGRQLQESDLGSVYGQVKVKLEGSQDPNHQLQDGDAAFVAPGSQVYRVNGYRPAFRVAARHDGRLFLYEADTNPAARVGADLLDMAGRVVYIGINSQADGITQLGTIKDPKAVQSLVDMVEQGAVNQSGQPAADLRYFVDFHLADGTEVIRAYWPGAGELARGIKVPDVFRTIVEAAISGTPVPSP